MDLTEVAEPEVKVQPTVEPYSPAGDPLAAIAAEIGLRRVRVVMLASLESHDDSVGVADLLTADALRMGLSVVRIDAGSGRATTEPGITDLSIEAASFGDVVHKSTREGLADVPWGHAPTISRRSARPMTLVEALADIYELVIVMTGRIGVASSLQVFTGANCPLLLVASAHVDAGLLDAARADAAMLGFDPIDLVQPMRKAAVA